MDKIEKGSQTAKRGFKKEQEIAERFNHWQTDELAQAWLQVMRYDLTQIEWVKAIVISGHKADLNVQIQVKLKQALDIENIQVKLVTSSMAYNQVDKRWLKNYALMWNIPSDIYDIFQHYTGELPPNISNPKDKRRMFMNEFSLEQQRLVVNWINENKVLILSDILKGRGEFCAEGVLVIHKTDSKWCLKNINEVIQHYYDDGIVEITNRGNLRLGKVTIQRKGGDAGRPTANMLQFKVNPLSLFN